MAIVSVYRFFLRKDRPFQPSEAVKPRRFLGEDERQHVLDTLNSERFVNVPAEEVYATLLDEGTYPCPLSTMYRTLKENNGVRERRNEARMPIM